MSRARVTVAGAGALGLTTALALARNGHQVALYDPAEPADNASGVAAGMLAPAFETLLDPLCAGHFELFLAARDLWPALAADIGVELDRTGALFVGAGPDVEAKAAGLERLGLSAKRLDAAALAERAPGLAPTITCGVATDADWRLDPQSTLAALRAAALGAGVRFHRAPAPAKPGDLLVVATGASQALAGAAPEVAGLIPVKGHILRSAAGPSNGPVVRSEGVYAAPSQRGLIVGATMETGVDDRAIDEAKAKDLQAAGARLFPALATAAFVAAAGVRAATPDGLPLAGWSSRPGVLLAVGARRNGWLLAPLVARALVACVERGGDAAFQKLSPTRFALQG